MNFKMALSMMENGMNTKCMARVATLTEMDKNGRVSLWMAFISLKFKSN